MLVSSDNARTWTHVKPISISNINKIVWNGTNFIAVGDSPNGLCWSPNGINWTSISHDTNLVSIACNGKICVAVGDMPNDGFFGILYSSNNGITWTTVTTDVSNFAGNYVAYNDDTKTWVVIGRTADGITSKSMILYSNNGNKWQTSNNIIISDKNNFISIAYNKKTWVICADEGIIYSTDNGVNWNYSTQENSVHITDEYTCISYNENIWFACGLNYILYSTNGITWEKSYTFSYTNAGNLCWNGKLWVCGISDDMLWFNDTSKTWTSTKYTDGSSMDIRAIECRYKV